MNLELTDEELVAITKRRDPRSRRAYGILVSRHQSWVLRMLQNLLRSSEAEEVKQDSFFTGWTHINELLVNSQYSGWIRAIAVKSAYKKHRRHRLERIHQQRAEASTQNEVLTDKVEELDAVGHVLLNLHYAHREILVLRYVEELTISEIATTLSLGESATKMRLLRARDLFKTKYLEDTRG